MASFRALSAILLFAILLSPALLLGQSYIYATGTPTFSTTVPVESGAIDVANGNLHIEIPIYSASQRAGVTLSSTLTYDSRIWQVYFNGTSLSWQPTNVANSNGGWRLLTTPGGSTAASSSTTQCFQNGRPSGAWTQIGPGRSPNQTEPGTRSLSISDNSQARIVG